MESGRGKNNGSSGVEERVVEREGEGERGREREKESGKKQRGNL